ncbi:hypothetical protein [Specibacter sp. RAF43]|uniref:hypothetical protein n=1 Tax=Specibacter sp. RAF43 TaxID=3233057 RepID=UPI003F9DB161
MAGIGGVVRAGPAPDDVDVVALRVRQIAQEIDAIRLELGPLWGVDWRSPAAAAFRERLLERNDALAGAVRDVQAAAAAVQLHARRLRSAAPASAGPALWPGLGPGAAPWPGPDAGADAGDPGRFPG